MRKNFIDNLRVFCILLLFPYHTFMIYNNFGEAFYIHGESLDFVTVFMGLVYPWWMTLLFTLAGISSAYALKKRTAKTYLKERLKRLLLPLFVAIALIIPIQSYIADCFHNNYQGNYFSHYLIFFTKFTTLSGYDGGFTPAHTWFMLFLFVISIIMLPFMRLYIKGNKKIDGSKVKLWMLLPCFMIILIAALCPEIGGKNLGESLACFALGFYLLSSDEVQNRLEKNCLWLTLLFLASIALRIILWKTVGTQSLLFGAEQRIVTWFGILSLMGLFKKYLNGRNAVSSYLSGASFSLYYFHQTFLVVIGFFVLKYIHNTFLQIVVIMVATFIVSVISYEIFRRFKVTSLLFGIKYLNKEKKNTPQTKEYACVNK